MLGQGKKVNSSNVIFPKKIDLIVVKIEFLLLGFETGQ